MANASGEAAAAEVEVTCVSQSQDSGPAVGAEVTLVRHDTGTRVGWRQGKERAASSAVLDFFQKRKVNGETLAFCEVPNCIKYGKSTSILITHMTSKHNVLWETALKDKDAEAVAHKKKISITNYLQSAPGFWGGRDEVARDGEPAALHVRQTSGGKKWSMRP